MIGEEEHYRRVCSSIDFFTSRMERTFSFFVQISVATIGGFLWLKMQPNVDAAKNIFPIVEWIIPFVALVAIAQTISDTYSWFGFRREEAKLLNRPDLMPSFPKSGRLEAIRVVVMIVAAIGGFWFLR